MREAAIPPVFTGQRFKKTEPRAAAFGPTSVNDRYVPLDYFQQAVLRIQAERVESFSTLPEGWNQGRGIPSTAPAVSEAIRFLREALAQANVVAETAPLDSGGVLLEWTFGELELHVEIDASGTADFFISRGDEILEENSLRFVGPHIRQLREALTLAVH